MPMTMKLAMRQITLLDNHVKSRKQGAVTVTTTQTFNLQVQTDTASPPAETLAAAILNQNRIESAADPVFFYNLAKL